MTVVATTYEAELSSSTPNNLFKAVGGIIFTAPLTVAIPAAFTAATTADLTQLSLTDWTRLGLISKGDGITFSRDQSTEDTESWGFQEPTRTDIVSDVKSAKFTLQETKRVTMEMANFIDLSSLTPDSTTGEVGWNDPVVPALTYRRMIFMAVDGAGTDRRYKFKIMPRAQVTAVDDETWSQSDATAFPITVTAKVDTTLGYAVRTVLAGPGQKSRNSAQGFGS